MNKQRGKTWFRIEFLDGSFFYLPFCFRTLITTINEIKRHGKVTKIKKMENRL